MAPFCDFLQTQGSSLLSRRLVLGGAGMMVAFPLAYSIILPALYLPVIVMLLGPVGPSLRTRRRHVTNDAAPSN